MGTRCASLALLVAVVAAGCGSRASGGGALAAAAQATSTTAPPSTAAPTSIRAPQTTAERMAVADGASSAASYDPPLAQAASMCSESPDQVAREVAAAQIQLELRGVQQTRLRILQELASVGSSQFDCLTILAVYVVGRGGGT